MTTVLEKTESREGPRAGSGAERTAGHLERLRRAEIESIRPYFASGARVLEIGGGSGYQAALILSWGCPVESIDLPSRPSRRESYFPVRGYDGRNFPFPAASFDVVFSSNVLEHIADLPGLLQEVRRVLIPGGKAIHIVPTTAWRFWTGASHYLYLLKYLAGQSEMACAEVEPRPADIVRRRGLGYLIQRAVFPGPHGEYPNAISELYYYSRRRWFQVFQQNGFCVQQVFPAGLFHTGYAIFPHWDVRGRQKAASWLGSACQVFVMGLGTCADEAGQGAE